MTDVSIRELRNQGGEIVDRVARGEEITITRAGRPVASLLPVAGTPLGAEALLARWRSVPPGDPEALRRDLGAVLDASL